MPYADRQKQLDYQNESNKRRRLEWLSANGPCVSCGSRRNLEVDHIDPSQKTTHRIWSLTEKRRIAELSKCQVLCSSCHRTKSNTQIKRLSNGRFNGVSA